MSKDISWLPGHELRRLIAERKLSVVEVIDHFLDRIAKLDPVLHAFDVVDPQGAREQALAAQEAVDKGEPLGPLHGIPVGIMDGIKVKGFRNPLWGSDAAAYDALCVERLRKAGAIIVGTTATYYWEPLDRPRNPWDLTRDSGNSSRGSAVAVASGMLPVAIGMDGAGSTRLPASWSGCQGVNPSRGLVAHVDYEDPSLVLTQTMGPIARTARDCALVLQVIGGRDGRDFISTQFALPDYQAALEQGIDGLRLAWTDDFGWSRAQWVDETEDLTAIARKAAMELAEKGATVDTPQLHFQEPRGSMFMLGRIFSAMGYEPPMDMEHYSERVNAIDEAWGWPVDGTGFTMPEVPEPDAEMYRQAAETRAALLDEFYGALENHDAILSLTTPMEPRPLAEWGLGGRDFTMTSYSAHTALANVIGVAAMSVPCGFHNGLPVGLQIMVLPGKEDLMLRIAQAIEQAHPVPYPPASAA
ncbi:amidase [Novosphingobium malaysiense]|uniref:Amidase domain-containing protein n=1 Tax=Novosphingobium malaysiense TaxID=1348853 RepID=A0A0B1ZIJ7_9SPHN|nr:amidase [Novosphingobium malaysiense]KHK90357.1 hypothetical protein LK12_17325 [Novosphingobium malaysiense]